MKIAVLFALLVAFVPALADALPSCKDILTIRVEGDGYTPYDLIQKNISWSSNFDRPLKVDYVNEDGTIESVQQTAFNWHQFAQHYPQFVKYGSRVLDMHKTMMRHWSVRWVMATSMLPALRSQHIRDLRRQMPGEVGVEAVFSGPAEISSPMLSSVLGDGQTTNDESKMLSRLKFDPAGLINQMKTNPQMINGGIDVLIFHTHPAGALPLSPEDQDLMIATTAEFQKAFPGISVRVVMVAAAKIRTQGDLLFVSEYRSAP